jgi:alpha-mannosidase
MKVCVVPHFHYDVAYLDTYRNYLPRCFENLVEAMRLLDTYPEYKCLIEQVILLEEFLRAYPEYEERLSSYARAGRVEFAPGMYCMPDMNIPSGESLIRQAYYGWRFLIERMGVEPITAWIADCFGHPPTAPKILKHCGFRYYAFARGLEGEHQSDFIWQSSDGSGLITHWMPLSYNPLILHQRDLDALRDPAGASGNDRFSNMVKRLARHASSSVVLLPNGHDFLKPQEISLTFLSAWNAAHPNSQAECSTAADYFAQLDVAQLAVKEVDFNPVHKGCYSSRIGIKIQNWALEDALLTAETAWALAWLQNRRLCPPDMDNEWKALLKNQFHDIICGTIIDAAYKEAMAEYRQASDCVAEYMAAVWRQFGLSLCSDGKAGSREACRILVLNPTGHRRLDVAEVNVGATSAASLPGAQIIGEPVPGVRSLLVEAEAPATGITVVNVAQPRSSSSLSVCGRTMENRFYRLALAEDGTIDSLVAKDSGREYIREKMGGNELVGNADYGDLWTYYYSPGQPGRISEKEHTDKLGDVPIICRQRHQRPAIAVVETGPIRAALQVSGTLSFWQTKMQYVQTIYLYDRIPRIDFVTRISPSGRQFRLRVAFPTSMEMGSAYYAVPYGMAERPAGEFPVTGWVDYGTDEAGVVLAARGIPGMNVSEGTLLLSIMRSVNMSYKGPSDTAWEDGVEHVFHYALIPYGPGGRRQARTVANDYLRPLRASVQPLPSAVTDAGRNGGSDGFLLDLADTGLHLGACCIQNGSLMVRLLETTGREYKGALEVNRSL